MSKLLDCLKSSKEKHSSHFIDSKFKIIIHNHKEKLVIFKGTYSTNLPTKASLRKLKKKLKMLFVHKTFLCFQNAEIQKKIALMV